MILLYCYMVAVTLIMGTAGIAEYYGLKQNVSGANGFIWTMMLILSVAILMVCCPIAWAVWGLKMAGIMLLGGGVWLALMGLGSLALMMAGSDSE